MKRIIDNRKKEKFMIDDEYLNGMARLCGHNATLVYMSLCRHADKEQHCFPSLKLMAEQHDISIDSIKRGIKKLKDRNVVKVGKKRTEGGQWLNNTYTLLDKSVWIYDQSANSTVADQSANMPSPECKYAPHQSAVSTTKETHSKETHKKETHLLTELRSEGEEKDIISLSRSVAKEKESSVKEKESSAQVINLFKEVNPSYKTLFNRKPQHDASNRLLEIMSFQEIEAIVGLLPAINSDQYAKGKSISPWELEKNLGWIKANIEKDNSNKIVEI